MEVVDGELQGCLIGAGWVGAAGKEPRAEGLAVALHEVGHEVQVGPQAAGQTHLLPVAQLHLQITLLRLCSAAHTTHNATPHTQHRTRSTTHTAVR